ncbi:MAG: hypothetical protein KF774_15260 [Planctomyces sp.]|nr:hypothetical protein [Planctomyces sp.]
MSEQTTHSEHAAASTADEPLFPRNEVTQFENDDREAGVAIGQMLSLLFIYTLLVMGLSTVATYAHWMGQ